MEKLHLENIPRLFLGSLKNIEHLIYFNILFIMFYIYLIICINMHLHSNVLYVIVYDYVTILYA